MDKFWNWVRNEQKDEFGSERTLMMDGPISNDTWWGDEVTPKAFRDELYAEEGPITLWISIWMKYTATPITTAAKAGLIKVFTTSCRYLRYLRRDPSTIAMGDAADFKEAIAMLQEVKESIINAYETKTLMARDKISRMMDNTTWMNAKKALELKFCDEILFAPAQLEEDGAAASAFSMKVVNSAFINKFIQAHPKPEEPENTVPADQLMKRLELLKH